MTGGMQKGKPPSACAQQGGIGRDHLALQALHGRGAIQFHTTGAVLVQGMGALLLAMSDARGALPGLAAARRLALLEVAGRG